LGIAGWSGQQKKIEEKPEGYRTVTKPGRKTGAGVTKSDGFHGSLGLRYRGRHWNGALESNAKSGAISSHADA